MSARWTVEEYNAYLERQTAVPLPPAETRAWEARGTETSSLEPEDKFMARVIALAKVHGYLCYHTHNSERSEPGFPDLVITNGREVLFIECKTNRGQLTMAQQRWLSLLANAGQEVNVWRPRDWAEIEERLTRKTLLS